MRQTPHLAARDTLKENKSPEESIDHSNPFEIKHVPANYAIRDTLLVKKPIPITSKKTANPNFLFVTISILLLFLTMLVVLNRSLLANIYRAILSDTFLKSVYRFQNNSQTLSYGLFYLFFILNAGLFLFLLLKQMKVDYFSSDPILFFVCVGIIASVYLVRHLVLKIIGVIFPVTKEVGYFNFTILAFNIFLGIALLPINGLISFSGDYIATLCLYIGVIIFVILYSIRQLRGMLLAANFLTYQKFHFIIYLCTVEIAPVIILAKLIFTSIGNSI
ncbi:MAG: DUF4271 domain-containing protein [Saprospiraceae bacterium]|nr:DUF4271 domain-containing protein [Saprospiraceae bacterium]MCA0333962.1 DUF4271 domain-containing protein [Bacteroidota bacterium]MCB0604406.1 DUF4271 domain-containing protein [Saprospiraceae bacterium]MCO5278218.1 DUF4271 domain-containing protein [Saprospiraceae bacterium]